MDGKKGTQNDNVDEYISFDESNDGENATKRRGQCVQPPENILNADLNSLMLGREKVQDKVTSVSDQLLRTAKDASTNNNSTHTFLLDETQFFYLGSCSICLLDFNDGDVVCWSKNPDCPHAFHRDCILSWLMRNNLCPCCRNDYVYDAKEGLETQALSLEGIAVTVPRTTTGNMTSVENDV